MVALEEVVVAARVLVREVVRGGEQVGGGVGADIADHRLVDDQAEAQHLLVEAHGGEGAVELDRALADQRLHHDLRAGAGNLAQELGKILRLGGDERHADELEALLAQHALVVPSAMRGQI